MKKLVRFAIIREVFLAGSLLKSEVSRLLARQRKRNALMLAKVSSMTDLSAMVEEVCDELTLEHILVGVTSLTAQTVEASAAATETQEPVVEGSKRKRDVKKARKEESKVEIAVAA